MSELTKYYQVVEAESIIPIVDGIERFDMKFYRYFDKYEKQYMYMTPTQFETRFRKLSLIKREKPCG